MATQLLRKSFAESKPSSLSLALDFLHSIGIIARRGEVPASSFIPNITVVDGVIVYNDKAEVSDLLHEAGHLATLPAKYRHICQADFGKSVPKIWEQAKQNGEIDADSPMCRAILQSSDPEATAWAWAAGKHIGLPEEEIILDRQYNNEGADQRFALATNCHFGINGMRAGGMIERVKDFPKMKRWIQTGEEVCHG